MGAFSAPTPLTKIKLFANKAAQIDGWYRNPGG